MSGGVYEGCLRVFNRVVGFVGVPNCNRGRWGGVERGGVGDGGSMAVGIVRKGSMPPRGVAILM